MSTQGNDPANGFEIFEHEPAWMFEYRKSRAVSAWSDGYPEQFKPQYSGRRSPGTAYAFAQHALQFLLWRDYGIRSLTWLQIGSVDKKARERALNRDWVPVQKTTCKAKATRTLAQWNTMRERMGEEFETLQQAIVGAEPRFKPGQEGEPDLFCYRDDGLWFFAEAKTRGEPLGDKQIIWFDIAKEVLGPDRAVFLCRVLEKGTCDPSKPKHTERWKRMVGQF